MFRFKSMLSRIVILHITAMVATAALMALTFYSLFSAELEKLQHDAVREQTESLARHLKHRDGGGWTFELPAGLMHQYSSDYGRYAYAILDDSGNVLFSSRQDRQPIFPPRSSAAEIEYLQSSTSNRLITGASLRREVDGRVVFIQAAENLAHGDVLIDDVVTQFIPKVGWITLPILLLLLLFDLLIFRRAIQPLLRASDQASHISPARMEVRLPLDDIPSEIRPLVIAVNQALDRLEEGFRRQREFTGDAAHELRTPLAILRTRIETWPDKQVGEAMRRDLEGMSRTVNQLLDAAELESLTIGPQDEADLHEVCMQVAEAMAPIALAHERSLALSGTEDPVRVRGNADMLERALTNLVDNALKHTPKGADVEIVVGDNGTVSVLDRGAGVATAHRTKIFERFWRKDRKHTEGAGLGLSIVKRIVEAHGAAISVDNRPSGGASFSMHFALAGDSGPPAQAPTD